MPNYRADTMHSTRRARLASGCRRAARAEAARAGRWWWLDSNGVTFFLCTSILRSTWYIIRSGYCCRLQRHYCYVVPGIHFVRDVRGLVSGVVSVSYGEKKKLCTLSFYWEFHPGFRPDTTDTWCTAAAVVADTNLTVYI